MLLWFFFYRARHRSRRPNCVRAVGFVLNIILFVWQTVLNIVLSVRHVGCQCQSLRPGGDPCLVTQATQREPYVSPTFSPHQVCVDRRHLSQT